jgi:hypothetical protein
MLKLSRLSGLTVLLSVLLAGCGQAPPTLVSVMHTASVPPVSREAPCRLSDLTASADWQSVGEALTGEITLANYTSRSCTLSGVPRAALLDGRGNRLAVNQKAPVVTPVGETYILAAGSVAGARVVWSNWCGEAAPEGLTLRVSLAGHEGQVQAALADPNGRPRDETPACLQPSADSTIEVSAFGPLE